MLFKIKENNELSELIWLSYTLNSGVFFGTSAVRV